ncbi:hypothetical protein F5Y17DRAFT_460209 [Xylariaceae sp. FL0594]|nr:hypothetical protein F5Y17DRAFT_460209 [Xylariaceae sp. FL0594]
MEALAIVGLAANICGFIDFASKLVSSSRAIYRSASGISADNCVLEIITRDVQYHCDKIQIALGSSPEVTALAGQSHQIAQELLGLISRLNTKSKKSKWDSFLQALHDGMKKSEVSALVQRLSDLSKQITSHMLLHLLSQQGHLAESLHRIEAGIRPAGADLTKSSLVQADLETAAVATRAWEAKISSTLDQCVHLLKKVAEGHTSLNAGSQPNSVHVTGTSQDVTAFAAFPTTCMAIPSPAGAQIEIGPYLNKLQRDGDFLHTYHKTIQKLQFEAIRYREHHIHEAHAQTFKWILDESRQDVHFAQWLKGKGDNNIFWIQGKPGAGKSTLMKYICQQPETQRYLESWAEDDASLMHHMDSRGKREIQEALNTDSWSVQILASVLVGLVQATPQTLYCFFIEGLDEFEGHPDALINTIDSLAKLSNVKVCLSSRPWPQFQDAYGHDRNNTLEVESLTRDDIRAFVTERLHASRQFQVLASSDQTYQCLVEDVVERANGIFLGVVLVVRSLLDGLSNRDSIQDLRAAAGADPDRRFLVGEMEGNALNAREYIALHFPELHDLEWKVQQFSPKPLNVVASLESHSPAMVEDSSLASREPEPPEETSSEEE